MLGRLERLKPRKRKPRRRSGEIGADLQFHVHHDIHLIYVDIISFSGASEISSLPGGRPFDAALEAAGAEDAACLTASFHDFSRNDELKNYLRRDLRALSRPRKDWPRGSTGSC